MPRDKIDKIDKMNRNNVIQAKSGIFENVTKWDKMDKMKTLHIQFSPRLLLFLSRYAISGVSPQPIHVTTRKLVNFAKLKFFSAAVAILTAICYNNMYAYKNFS